MKKLLLLTTILSVLFAVISCSQVESEDVCKVEDQTSLTIGLPTTRTSLGEKEGDNYPTYWSENDVIVANGATSTSLTLGADKTSAIFGFANSILTPPYHITYPYSNGSLCAENRPTVVFNAEQNYVERTFGVGDAPMCGYYEGGDRIILKHLAGILRFAIKGSATLAKIEILANEEVALAGEFDVNCQAGTISAIEGKTTNKITYIVNKTLSTTEAKVCHIVVPTGNLGACKVLLTADNGEQMILKWNASDVKAGVVREFKAFTFKPGTMLELEGLPSEEDDLVIIPPTPRPANNEIWYTATKKVEPYYTDVFGANIVSNVWDETTNNGVITFDGEVTSIGNSAFSECSSLTSITIPNSVTLIGEKSFYFCLQLIEVTLGNNIAKIGDFAFYHCGKLSSITIPSKVTSLGDYTFYNCSCLKEVYCMPTIPPSIGNSTLSEYIKGAASYPLNCKIYVPRESIDTYKTQKYWSVHSSRIEPYDF